MCCFHALSTLHHTRYNYKAQFYHTAGNERSIQLFSHSGISLRMCYRAAVSSSALDRLLIRGSSHTYI